MNSSLRSDPDPDSEDYDPAIDFCNLSVRLDRPSDHYRPPNLYEPPPRRKRLTPHQIATRFLNDPVTTTLSSFSRVAHWAWAPHEEYDNVLQMITSRTESSPQPQQSFRPPPPALPPISCTRSQFRLAPLTAAEFDDMVDKPAAEIINRVYRGGIADNDLRQRLWPLILGLTDDWKDFDFEEKENLFQHYNRQWQSILPDQESRFTSYKERKSLVERDVVRCDRTHPFYSDKSSNLDRLKTLLLSYVMHDFDTGYVQGMTDLASPLLYVYDGDVQRAFWCFVQVMNMFKHNFEMSQKTISLQLEMLFKLIRVTDPCFAQYLTQKESDNCYFAFRWIICLFKREFMKGKSDDYGDCLIVWETIWTATLLAETEKSETNEVTKPTTANGSCTDNEQSAHGSEVKEENGAESSAAAPAVERLTNAQLFVLCICLSIIRRERDLIMAQQYDACETLKHFNTLNLNSSLKDILVHASHIWFWLKKDGGEEQLYESMSESDKKNDSTNEDFDLLSDELISNMTV